MTDINLDKYIDSRLRNSELKKTPKNFTSVLMNKINTYAFEAEIRKEERTANYIIGFFSSLLGVVTLWAGYKAVTTLNVTYLSAERINIFFQKVINLLGFAQTSNFVLFVFVMTAASSLYLLADRFLIKHKP